MLSLIDALAMMWIDWRYARKANRFAAEHPEYGLALQSATIDKDGLLVCGSSPAIIFLAEEAAKMLERANAPNYVEIVMLPHLTSDIRPVRVTVQYEDGKSPAQANDALLKAITMLYRLHPCDVAAVCDDFLDKSGALFGKVRSWASEQSKGADDGNN